MEFYPPAFPCQAVQHSTANRVRIIGGTCRGRVIRFPAEVGLRPTPDRVRETLFNWLGQDLRGRRTLDLFAGTGVLSLEALSRGAMAAVAVDHSLRLVEALRANARMLGLSGLETHRGDAQAFLENEQRRFDVVFADPPFAADPWERLLPACATRLTASGMIYVEAGRPIMPPAGWGVHRTGRAGQVYYHLLAPIGPR